MYFLPEFGSAPILMNELATHLTQTGRDVEIVTTIPRPPQNKGYKGRIFIRETRNGYRVKRFLTNFTVHHIGRLIAWSIFTVSSWINLLTVRRDDIVFLRLPPLQLGVTGMIARRLLGARVLLNLQDIHPDLSIESGLLKNPFAVKIAKAFEKWIYDNTEEILVISEGFKKNLEAKGVPSSKIVVIPNWVDTDFLRPLPKDNPVSRKYGLTEKFVVMYSGTISISSSLTLERVLEAADLLKDDSEIMIVIVGEGLKKNDLVEKTERLGLKNAVFLPFQPYQDLPNLLASADVLVVPLDKEKSLLSVPSKLYNFMATGRPILSLSHSDSEVFKIIEDTKCGVNASPGDPKAIDAAIRGMKESREIREAMGRSGREYAVANFSRHNVMELYDRLISRTSRSI
jgi:colanic acid biosynthesis glycosyl transferase WcaI